MCAQRFVLSPLKLYTSMKVTDSLDKKLSLFYTELQRLKMIMDAILGKEPAACGKQSRQRISDT